MNCCYCNTTKVYFTNSVITDINEFLSNTTYRKALLIAGGNYTSNIANKIGSQLKIESLIISGVSTNPTSDIIHKIANQAKNFMPDIILTIGGGSVHDCGKAVAIMYYDEFNSIEDYTVNGKFSVPGIKTTIPVITIPTIVGSGAEVSPAALVRVGKEKRVVFSPLLHPLATFVDIVNIRRLPKEIAVRSIFDSFIQALEGYISLSANTISDVFASQTLQLFNECYNNIKLWDRISEKEIEKLAIASIFSSYVCSTASVGAIHALSDPISGRYNIHHGTALAMVACNVLEKNLTTVSVDRLQTIDNILSNITIDYSDKHDAYSRILAKTGTIISDFNLLDDVPSIIVESQMIEECKNPDMAGNPYDLTDSDIESILRNI